MVTVSGAVTIRPSRIFNKPVSWIALTPNAAKTAPTSPPISACVELDGMRQYHATSIHTTVAVSPA